VTAEGPSTPLSPSELAVHRLAAARALSAAYPPGGPSLVAELSPMKLHSRKARVQQQEESTRRLFNSSTEPKVPLSEQFKHKGSEEQQGHEEQGEQEHGEQVRGEQAQGDQGSEEEMPSPDSSPDASRFSDYQGAFEEALRPTPSQYALSSPPFCFIPPLCLRPPSLMCLALTYVRLPQERSTCVATEAGHG
jgi:hypothetical protein